MNPRAGRTQRAPGKHRRKALADLQSARWFRTLAALMGCVLRYWVRRYQVIGAERVPSHGGTFLIANHTSGMDPVFLGYPLRRQCPAGPGKVELFANPVFGYLLRKIGVFPLRQGEADATAVRSMVELYRSGRMVMVYPEGGRSKTGELRPFMPDFARLVIKLRARVVPAGMAGARDVLPVGAFFPRHDVPIAVSYGEPFELSDFYDRKLTSDEMGQATAILEQRVAEQVGVATAVRDRMRDQGA